MNKQQLQALLEYVQENGGATLTPYGKIKKYAAGYQVALSGYEAKTAADHIDMTTLNRHLLTARKMKACAGLWMHNGWIYMDISINVQSKKSAFSLAKREKQISIWAWEEQGEIKTGAEH